MIQYKLILFLEHHLAYYRYCNALKLLYFVRLSSRRVQGQSVGLHNYCRWSGYVRLVVGPHKVSVHDLTLLMIRVSQLSRVYLRVFCPGKGDRSNCRSGISHVLKCYQFARLCQCVRIYMVCSYLL